jgi:hypothetical protein
MKRPLLFFGLHVHCISYYHMLCDPTGQLPVKIMFPHKGKVKFTLEQVTKAQWGSRGITVLFL